MRFSPVADAPRRARRMLRQALVEAGVDEGDEVADIAVLLASELFDNAVLHAGTDFEVEVDVDADEVGVTVTDRGSGPLELHLAQPRPRYGRAASHGRGLAMVQHMATAWGTRHETDGRHRIWFTLTRDSDQVPPRELPEQAGAAPQPAQLSELSGGARRADVGRHLQNTQQAHWLLHLPARAGSGLDTTALVAELVRRLRELLDADGVSVDVDHADGAGVQRMACDGLEPDEAERERVVEVPLPLAAPLRGRLRFVHGVAAENGDPSMAELAADRIALAVEAEWLRDADRRRQAWMAYIADTSELLGQSLDVELTVAVVPQVVVPRLGQWCAVYLPDATGRPQLAALTHADENALVELRAALDLGQDEVPPGQLAAHLLALQHSNLPQAWFSVPTDGVAVALTVGGRPIGALAVGRPLDKPHGPEDVALIADIARRSALAIDNAQRATQHRETAQALQKALLPRALPTVPGIEFAAAYVPAGTGNEVGGDFYDIVPVAPDQWLLAIGDVCGKGPQAAARTSLVRDVLRVLVKHGLSLLDAIQALNEIMIEAADPTQFCTLAAAMITRRQADDPDGPGVLAVDLVLAGHPKPIIVRANGTSETIGEYGTAAGLVDRLALTKTTHVLGHGDTLLAYTDGVTERRRGQDQFGSERLVEATSGTSERSARKLVDHVCETVDRFSNDERSDDIALLAVRAVRA